MCEPSLEAAPLLIGQPRLLRLQAIRLVVDPEISLDTPRPAPDPTGSIRSAGGAVLVTAPDTADDDPTTWTVATQRAPTDAELLTSTLLGASSVTSPPTPSSSSATGA